MAVRIIARRGVVFQGEPQPLSEKPVTVIAERHAGWGGGWVARIDRIDPKAKGGLARTFLSAWERRLSRAGNGVVEFGVTEPGVYEIEYVRRSFEAERVYVAIYADGRVREVGYHSPGYRRSPRLDAAIAAALAEFAAEPAVEETADAAASA